ncbi:substrate-binding domain-containing protein [Roseivivax sediminis]|uniref:Quinoprotein dehydrogenase-associated probable ABC transporter substrate-binding protein n=1 Tax=Roseivivax sediminis TaxID=936889 RepID=A0A1I1TW36_9RHOB|nr:substrate-binding domain-containing protein [Roseivivax sediminis]SFD62841.1 quinoprotein dehydrogenase-associated probable ABC transporter substrate-binding protein [Roseivivax sediminis]
MPAWAAKPSGLLVLALLASQAGPVTAQTSDLVSQNAFRVCADPANYPMSNEAGEGFENKIAALLAEKLDRPLTYEWFPMATGFIRNTLAANRCDVVIGYAQGHELVQNTNHYFTSVYTLIVPEDGELSEVTALSDPALEGKRIGVIAGSPPGNHMARNGLMGDAEAYRLFVDRRYESPAQDMLADLDAGELDAAVLWGPIGGPLVKDEHPDMKVVPLIAEDGPPRLFFRITMGVRRGEEVWKRELNSLIRRHQDEINAILSEAGVPLVNDMGTEIVEVSQ